MSIGIDLGNLVCWSVFVLIFLIVGVYLLFNWRWESRWLGELQQVSARRGWSFEKPPERGIDAVITGAAEGIPWTITYTRARRQNSSSWIGQNAAAWQAPQAALPNGVVMVLPPIANIPPNLRQDPTGMNTMLLRFLFSKIGIDSDGMQLQDVGSTAFQDKYLVLSGSQEDARSLVTPMVESQLLNWPPVSSRALLPAIIVNKEGLQVTARRDMKVNEIFGDARLHYERELPDRLVRLGVIAVEAMRDAVG